MNTYQRLKEVEKENKRAAVTRVIARALRRLKGAS